MPIIGNLAAKQMNATGPGTVLVSFTDPWTTPDYVDISLWCRSAKTVRGRQHELRRMQAGTADLTVNNQDGRFSTFNTTGPYVNLLSAADAGFDGASLGTWAAGTNQSGPAIAAGLGFDGTSAMALTATGSGFMTALTATGTAGYPVTAGLSYNVMAAFMAAVTPRICSVQVTWYNSGGSSISTTAAGTATDSTSAYVKASGLVTAPAGAVFAAVVARVNAAAASEVHYVDRVGLFTADRWANPMTGWGPGGRGLVPARTVQINGIWQGVTYPVFTGYVDSWVPKYKKVTSDQVIACTDAMNLCALANLTSSAYPGQVLADGAVGYWRMGDQGPNFADSSGQGNTLYPQLSAIQYGVPGALLSDTNAAATFSGASYATSVGALVGSNNPGGTGNTWQNFTIECWVNTSALPAQAATIVGLSGGAAFSYDVGGLLFNSGATGSVSAAVKDNIVATSTSDISDGNWHHLVAVGQDELGSAYVTLYIDGQNAATGSVSGGGGSTAPANVWVGTDLYNSYSIDEVAVYPTQLTGAQIALHYAMGLAGFVQQQSGQRVAAVLKTLGIPTASTSIATGISAVQPNSTDLTTSPALSHIQTVEATEQGVFYVDPTGVITFKDRHFVLTAPASTTSQCTLSSTNANGTLPYMEGSVVPTDDALDLWNDVPVSAVANTTLGVSGNPQTAENTTSQSQFGRRTLTGFTSMLQTTDAEALSLAQWLLTHYGIPIGRVRSIAMDSTANNGGNFVQMLSRHLLDQVTVIWQPLDGTSQPFVQPSNIEQISHDIQPASWTTTWALAPAESQTYFVLGDAVLGKLAGPGSTAQNRVGY